MARTVPVPSPDELRIAQTLIDAKAVEAVATIMATNRWLDSIIHDIGKSIPAEFENSV